MRNHRAGAIRFLVLGIGLNAGACSLAVDAGREQCVTNSDCARLGPELPDGVCVASLCRDLNWVCLDEPPEVPALPVPNRVRVIVPFVDLLTRQQVPGIEIRACERRDADCQMPVASAGGNENGEADLRLPGGFNGYLRLQSPNIYPTMFFFGMPIVSDSIFPVEVVSPETFAGLNTQFSDIAVEGRAAVLVYVKNCGGTPGAGVSLSVPGADSATRSFYLVDTLFPPGQTETTGAGLARLVNVPEGNITILGTLADGREIGRASVLTQAGFVTLTDLRPTPLSDQ